MPACPVMEVTETLPAGKDYLTWQSSDTGGWLAVALGNGTHEASIEPRGARLAFVIGRCGTT